MEKGTKPTRHLQQQRCSVCKGGVEVIVSYSWDVVDFWRRTSWRPERHRASCWEEYERERDERAAAIGDLELWGPAPDKLVRCPGCTHDVELRGGYCPRCATRVRKD